MFKNIYFEEHLRTTASAKVIWVITSERSILIKFFWKLTRIPSWGEIVNFVMFRVMVLVTSKWNTIQCPKLENLKTIHLNRSFDIGVLNNTHDCCGCYIWNYISNRLSNIKLFLQNFAEGQNLYFQRCYGDQSVSKKPGFFMHHNPEYNIMDMNVL